MIAVNIHQAKSSLSHLVMQVEKEHRVVTLCRHGTPVAQIVPLRSQQNPLLMHGELQGVKIQYDPSSPLTSDEWPEEQE